MGEVNFGDMTKICAVSSQDVRQRNGVTVCRCIIILCDITKMSGDVAVIGGGMSKFVPLALVSLLLFTISMLNVRCSVSTVQRGPVASGP